jgi:hypothetical protein
MQVTFHSCLAMMNYLNTPVRLQWNN